MKIADYGIKKVTQVFNKIHYSRTIITATYYGPSDAHGSRIMVFDDNSCKRIWLNHDSSLGIPKQVVKYLNRCGIYVSSYRQIRNGRYTKYMFVVNNWTKKLYSIKELEKYERRMYVAKLSKKYGGEL